MMRVGDLAGKTAIVTGGGRGLGRAMALGLARAGANVVITAARGSRELEVVAAEAAADPAGGRVRAVRADVTSQADCPRVVDETLRAFGGVHVLVNNAGRGMRFVWDPALPLEEAARASCTQAGWMIPTP
jgi:NAD(P)-dependent dehydrogenase (short-subunit alcohol dehydrogenase family)